MSIDAVIATTIIDAVDDSGYLSTTIEDIYAGLALADITQEEVEIVLKRIQHFDPIGVAAKNLKDCLLIQLSTLPRETRFLKEVKLIINDHLELLGNRDFRQLSRKTKLKETALKEIIAMIQRLDPKPGGKSFKLMNHNIYSTYFKMHPPTQQKTRIVSPFLGGLAVHLEVY